MSRVCRLCSNERELQKSHIIPNFVITWLTKTGATPFLRSADNPDTRIQDKKEKLLCRKCEQSLSEWEGRFASNIFYPVIRQEQTKFEYDSWLQKFTMSLSWRVLVSSFSDWSSWSPKEQVALEAAEQDWRSILRGEQTLSDATRAHYNVLMGETESVPGDVPDGWEFYASRGIDASIMTVNDGIFVYTKFPQMFFLSCVDPNKVDGLDDALLELSGAIHTPQIVHSPWSEIPFRRAEAVDEKKASPREREKIIRHIQEHPDRLTDSKTIETYRRKFDRDGSSEHDPLDHLDEDECPICSTNHRIVDALPSRPLTRRAVENLGESKEVAFVKGIFVTLDETSDANDEDTGTIVLSTSDATRVITLLNPGWVVDQEIGHIDTADPGEFGNAIWELVKDEHALWMDQNTSDNDYTIG